MLDWGIEEGVKRYSICFIWKLQKGKKQRKTKGCPPGIREKWEKISIKKGAAAEVWAEQSRNSTFHSSPISQYNFSLFSIHICISDTHEALRSLYTDRTDCYILSTIFGRCTKENWNRRDRKSEGGELWNSPKPADVSRHYGVISENDSIGFVGGMMSNSMNERNLWRV